MRRKRTASGCSAAELVRCARRGIYFSNCDTHVDDLSPFRPPLSVVVPTSSSSHICVTELLVSHKFVEVEIYCMHSPLHEWPFDEDNGL